MADKDERPWVKLSLDYFDNPKIDALSDTAQLLHLQLIIRSARMKTDGKVSARAAKERGDAALKELISGGLMVKVDAKTYWIHDYTKHQMSSEEIAVKSSAGSRGGHTKNHARRYLYDIRCRWCRGDAEAGEEWVKDPQTAPKET